MLIYFYCLPSSEIRTSYQYNVYRQISSLHRMKLRYYYFILLHGCVCSFILKVLKIRKKTADLEWFSKLVFSRKKLTTQINFSHQIFTTTTYIIVVVIAIKISIVFQFYAPCFCRSSYVLCIVFIGRGVEDFFLQIWLRNLPPSLSVIVMRSLY